MSDKNEEQTNGKSNFEHFVELKLSILVETDFSAVSADPPIVVTRLPGTFAENLYIIEQNVLINYSIIVHEGWLAIIFLYNTFAVEAATPRRTTPRCFSHGR